MAVEKDNYVIYWMGGDRANYVIYWMAVEKDNYVIYWMGGDRVNYVIYWMAVEKVNQSCLYGTVKVSIFHISQTNSGFIWNYLWSIIFTLSRWHHDGVCQVF